VFRVLNLRFALVLAAMLAVPASAQAEGLFGAILNFFSGGHQTQEPAAPPPTTPGPAPVIPLDHSGLGNQPIPPSRGGPQVVFCVRTCDGRYFPLPRNAGGSNMTPAKICGAMCPTAETKTYAGNNIETAVAPDGSRYANLKNAFVYREHLVDGCTCNGGGGAGNAAIDISADPTLRPGDIVVTGNGPMVFKGGKGGTVQGNFVPAAEIPRMSAKFRDKVTAIKVARPANAPVASPEDFAQDLRPTDEAVSPAATAAQIFDFKDFDAAELRGSMAMGYNGRQ